ncbi:MAG: PKD domain-containing protein [bacterium]
MRKTHLLVLPILFIAVYHLMFAGCFGSTSMMYPEYGTPVVTISANPLTGAGPLSVQFFVYVKLVEGAIVENYEWQFSTLGTSGDASPVFVFKDTGKYIVQCEVTDSQGKTGSDTIEITVIKPGTGGSSGPKVTINATPASGRVPLTVVFGVNVLAAAGFPIVGYQWNFGDGGQSADQNPTHIFTVAGTYSVSCTAVDSDGQTGQDTIQINVSELGAPVVTVQATPDSGFAPLDVQFNSIVDLDGGATAIGYSWDFGDGGQSTEASPAHTYSNAGQYTATCVVTDSNNKIGQGSVDVTVNESASPVVTVTANPQSGDAPLSVDFDVTVVLEQGASVQSYTWAFGDGGVSSAKNPTHEYATAGIYTATCQVLDSFNKIGQDSIGIPVSDPLSDDPIVAVSAVPEQGEVPLQVQFDVGVILSGGATVDNYAWTFGDGGQSTEQSPLYTYTTDGVFTATCVVTDSAMRTGQDSIDITVNPVVGDNPVVTVSAVPEQGVVPLEVQFDVDVILSGGATVSSYAWTFGDGGQSTIKNPLYTYTTDGSFTATCVVTDSELRTGQDSISITVNPVVGDDPQVTVSAVPEQGLVPLEVQFDVDVVLSGGATVDSYAWTFGDGGQSKEQSPLYAYTTVGVFTATCVVTDSEQRTGQDSIEIDVQAPANPIVTVNAIPTTGVVPLLVDFTVQVQLAPGAIVDSYAWTFGDGGVSSEENPTYTYLGTGLFTATCVVTDSNMNQGQDSIEIDVISYNDQFIGATGCVCHPTVQGTWGESGHSFAMTRILGTEPTFPFSSVPNPPSGISWSDVTYTMGGYGWKSLFMDNINGQLITGPDVQWNLGSATFGKFETDTRDVLDYDCGACHTTGWRSFADNGGLHQDDLTGILGTWAFEGVQCERCHGPANVHVTTMDANDIVVDPSSQLCGQCHTRGLVDRIYINPTIGLLKNNQQYDEFMASPHSSVLTCGTCHDHHASTKYDSQALGNGLKSAAACITCHPGKTVSGDMGSLDCTDCHMPLGDMSSEYTGTGVNKKGDLHTHLFAVDAAGINLNAATTTDGVDTWMTPDAGGKVKLNLAWSCMQCHNGSSAFLITSYVVARSRAAGMHD